MELYGITRVARNLLIAFGWCTGDGTRVVTASYLDATILLWDLKTGNLPQRLEAGGAHPGGIRRVSVTPDGRFLITTGLLDRVAALWDLQTGSLVQRLPGHQGEGPGPLAVAISRDGTRGVTAGGNRLAILRKLEQGRPERQDRRAVESAELEAAAICDDRSRVGVVDSKGAVFVWDLSRGQVTRRPTPGRAEGVSATAISTGVDQVLRAVGLTSIEHVEGSE